MSYPASAGRLGRGLHPLLMAGLLAGVALSHLGTAAFANGPLLLDVVVNGHAVGKVGDFQQVDGALKATRQELVQLGFEPGAGAEQDLVPLTALPETSYRLDDASQTVFVTAPIRSLRPAQLGPDRGAAPGEVTPSGTGFVLNYDATATVTRGRLFGDALLDARAFSPWGVLSSTALGRIGVGESAVRLDTTYTYSDPDSLRRLRVGDVIASGLAWTRPVRLGGAQFARDFSLRPDLVTFPVPSIAGQVAVPSSVDVLVNGVQQFSAPVPPGPFEVRSLPVVTGANTVALVIKDAAGRNVTETLPVYTSQSLLAAGLDAYSVEAGAVRLGYGVKSNEYRDGSLSFSYRRGLTDWLTVEAHGEATQAIAMGGGGVTVGMGRLGALSLAAAGSRAPHQHGVLGYAGFERISSTLSLSASAQWTDGRFTDVAAGYGEPVPRRTLRAGLGVPFGAAGSISLSYTNQRRSASTLPLVPQPGYATPYGLVSYAAPERLSLLAASYSVPVWHNRAFFFATAFRDFDHRAGSGALFGLTVPLGARGSALASAGVDSGGRRATLQANRSVDAVGDVGGQLLVDRGEPNRLLALGRYRSAVGTVELGVDNIAGRSSLRGGASGALVVAGGQVFATNEIRDSFAVVDTDGTRGVQVSYENRPVERTGSSGKVLVPDLRSFEANRISIEPGDIPLDAEVGPVVQMVRPQDRSGVVVHFPIRHGRAAILRLAEPGGSAVPVGSRARVAPDGAEAVVGYDGAAYLRELPSHGSVSVAKPGGASCTARFDYAPSPGGIPTIGPLVCAPDTGS